MPTIVEKPEELGGGKKVIEDGDSYPLRGVAKHRGSLSVLLANIYPLENDELGHVIRTSSQAGDHNAREWLGVAGSEYVVRPNNPGPIYIPDEAIGAKVMWVSSLEAISIA